MTALLRHATIDLTISKNGQTFARVADSDSSGNNSTAFPLPFNSVTSARAEVKMSEMAKIEVHLHPSFPDAIRILKSGLLGIGMGSKDTLPSGGSTSSNATNIDPGGAATATGGTNSNQRQSALANCAQMQITFLRPDETLNDAPFESQTYAGAITQPDVSLADGEVEIVLRGYANAIFLSGPQYNFVSTQKMSISDFCDKMAALINHEIVFEDDDNETEDLMANHFVIGPKQDTPLGLMKWALKEINAEFTCGQAEDSKSDGVIVIRERKSMMKKTPKYTFVQWRQVNPDNNVFPMWNFHMQSARSLFLSKRAFGVYRLGVDRDTKKATISTFGGNDFQMVETSTSNETLGSPDSSDETLTGWIKGEIKRSDTQDTRRSAESETVANLSDWQKFSFECPGLPDLKPMDLVQVMVADIEELSGVLLVTRVTHIWEGEWRCEIEGRRTGGLSTGPKEVKTVDISDTSGPDSGSATVPEVLA